MTLSVYTGSQEQYTPYLPVGDLDKPPDADYVMGLLRDYQMYYRPFHSQCKTEEDYYFGRNPVPAPEGHEAVHPATSRAIVDTATDHVDVGNIEIDVPSSPRSRARAEKIKKFYQGTWLSIKEPVLRTATRQAFMYGISFLKPVFNPDEWPDAPPLMEYETDEGYRKALEDFMETRRIKFPFSVRNVNPKNLIWDDSRGHISWAIEFYQGESRDIRRRYPRWLSEKNGSQMATWLEYWDERWCGYMADGQWLWGPYEHGYTYVPYVPIMSAASVNFDSGPPQERYQGILYPVHSLLDSEARLITAYEAMLRQYAWTTLNFHGQQQAADTVRQNYEMFGGQNLIPTGVEVRSGPMSTPPQELMVQLSLVQTMIEEATFPNVIRGVRPKGVSSGFGVSVLAGMGRIKFQGIADAMARAVERCNSAFARLVEHKLGGRVTVHGRSDVHNFDQTIGPDDIKGLYENRVAMKAEAPEEAERSSLLAMRMYQAGMMSLYEAQRRSRIANPLQEQVQMEAELLLQSPEMRAEKVRLAMEGMGLLSQLGEAVGVPPEGPQNVFGNQFQGLGGEPRLGERDIQQARVASQQGQPSVFPQGKAGIDNIGRILSSPRGGAQGVPSGQTVR